MTTQIVLNVSGGVVQDVFCSALDAELLQVDWDTDHCDPDAPGLIEVVDNHGHTDYAHVSKSRPHSMQKLSGTDVQKALHKAGVLELPKSGTSVVRRYVLFDFDAGDLATTNVYDDYREAADDASQLDNVIVISLVFEKEPGDATEPESTRPGPYHLAIDGPAFRSQRELLLKLQGLAAGRIPNVPDPGDRELLEGLIELTDELADQAHDKHGVDCLLDAGEGPCDCERPGHFCSGVPGILAHMENGRLAPGAKVERCDLCQRHPTDEAALEKLRELGYSPS